MVKSSGSQTKIRIDRTHILVSLKSPGPIREELVIMNEGTGRLYGNIRSDAPWVTVLDTTINTTFIQRVILEIRPEISPSRGYSWVHILSTGGIARIKVELLQAPVPASLLQIDEKNFHFCNISSNEPIPFSCTVRNAGLGVLAGRAVSLCDWIEIIIPGIWTRTTQVIPARIIPAKAPRALHPVGRVLIKTNGGEETVEVSIHRSLKRGPTARFIPSSLRISWSVQGIIEERLIVKNDGEGVLRGTIPSKYPWIVAIPSIFSVTESTVVTIRVDTRLIPGHLPASIPLSIITNAGPYTLNIEINRIYQAHQKQRVHLPRARTRSRMTVRDQHGRQYQIVASGKSGGEGEIWFIEDDESRCVKIFHPHRSNPEMEEKIRFMQKNPIIPPSGTSICWPSEIILSISTPSRFLGYLMPRLDSTFVPVHAWYDKPNIDFIFAMEAAARLARLVHAVHATGHRIGDLRENNVFINTKGEICLIDTDSFQISDPASCRRWYCRVGTGEFLPPELIDGSFEKHDIDRLFADRFALAVLIFRFLMQGAHPYQGRGPLIEDAPTTQDKIVRGLFAYEGKIQGLSPPEYAPPYDRIPSSVRAIFHDAFIKGHQNPKARPEPLRWAETLKFECHTRKYVCISAITNSEQGNLAKHEDVPKMAGEYECIDEKGFPIAVGRRIARICDGEIRTTDRSGFQVLITYHPLPPLPSSPPSIPCPPSVIIPEQMIFQNRVHEKKIHYLIPAIDMCRYVHWHWAADPDSRHIWSGGKFTFRHRIAACRNLLAAVLSIYRMGLCPFSLSPRSVFVGPDSSVRVIAIPINQKQREEGLNNSLLEAVRTLVCMMTMEGCNPDQVVARKRETLLRYVPSDARIPYPMKKIFAYEQYPPDSLDVVLFDWFSKINHAFSSLISCPINPDHWMDMHRSVCPFCQPDYLDRLLAPPPVQPLFQRRHIQLLSAPLHVGMSLIQREQIRKKTTSPVIILPESLWRPLSITGRPIQPLAARNCVKTYLPMIQQRCLPVCVIQHPTALIIIPPVISVETMILNSFDLSLIDEMRWISSLELMKGALFPRLIRKRKERRQYVRKTVSVMILPGHFETHERKSSGKGTKKKKPRINVKLPKKLSEFIEDLFG